METNHPIDLDYKIVGQNIKKYRKSKKLTQDDLAYLSGVSKQYLAVLESGNKRGRLGIYYRIAVALNVSLDSLTAGCAPQSSAVNDTALLSRINRYSTQQYEKLMDYMNFLDAVSK